MKRLLTLPIILLILLTLNGCKKPCKDITCVNGACVEGNCLCNDGWMGTNCDQVDECYGRNCNNGYCADGSCVCDPLWEGNSCNTPVNQKFVGNWAVSEVCTASGAAGYSVIVSALVNELAEVRISNLWNTGTVTGIVGSDPYNLSVPRQMISFGYDVEASSTITADGDTLTMAFTIYEQGGSTEYETCTATWIKY